MPSWSSTVSHAIPTDGQTDRKPGEAVDCGGRGDQWVHGQALDLGDACSQFSKYSRQP